MVKSYAISCQRLCNWLIRWVQLRTTSIRIRALSELKLKSRLPMSKLLFFPMSMPDETLQSRITRYHFLSGNKTEAETFRDLFDAAPFPLTIIPKQLEALADRLPGDKESNISELLAVNTVFPAYRPFLGLSKVALEGPKKCSVFEVARIPRREGASHARAKICISCNQQDLIEHGYAYWHRAHHLPGVAICWRHGEPLLHSCPSCSHPFYRKNKLLQNLTEGRVCGWNSLSVNIATLVSKEEREYAEFANDILQSNLPSVDWDILAACYRRQAKKRGFNHGGLIGTAKLFDSIQAMYGDEVLSRIDRAYAAGKRFQWIRLSTTRGQIDMPLARHLLICHHLFDSACSFEKCLMEESLLARAPKIFPSSKVKQVPPSKKQQHRDKIQMLIGARPDVGLEYLWSHAYQATRWLTENDKAWLLAKLFADQKPADASKSASDPRDEKYAALILDGVDGIYRITQRQRRANIGNLLGLLPTRVRMAPAQRRERYPIVSQQLELHLESLWHFRLRRAIWVVAEMARLKQPTTNTSVTLLSSLPTKAWHAIVNFFEWDLEKMTAERVDAEALLKATGVSRQWEGPPGYSLPMGGDAYLKMIAQTPRS